MPTDATTPNDQVSAWCAWDEQAMLAAHEAGVPARLFASLINRESGNNPDAPGGIAQIDRRFHDAPFGAMAELRYAASLVRRYHDELGRYDLAVAAYNAGYPTVKALGFVPWSSTRYVTNVLSDALEPSPCAPSPIVSMLDIPLMLAIVASHVLR